MTVSYSTTSDNVVDLCPIICISVSKKWFTLFCV